MEQPELEFIEHSFMVGQQFPLFSYSFLLFSSKLKPALELVIIPAPTEPKLVVQPPLAFCRAELFQQLAFS